MASRIEDYALIGDTRSAALIGRDGSIDWLCVPRFDSPACFAALLGTRENGRWLLAPAGRVERVCRRYRSGTLVLETDLATADGAVRIIDCMPLWPGRTDIVRIVEGVRGDVPMQMELVIRPGYGLATPWVRRVDSALLATAGPDSLELRTPVATRGKRFIRNLSRHGGPSEHRSRGMTDQPPGSDTAPAPGDGQAKAGA
jgi:GH15 family glucan-1,4-alpha-glucosidase